MSSQGKGKSKTSSPKSIQSHELRARQDARQAHSLLENLYFLFLGHSEPEGKPSRGRDGETATKLHPAVLVLDSQRCPWDLGVAGEGESQTPQSLLSSSSISASSCGVGKTGKNSFWFIFFFFSVSLASSIVTVQWELKALWGSRGSTRAV